MPQSARLGVHLFHVEPHLNCQPVHIRTSHPFAAVRLKRISRRSPVKKAIASLGLLLAVLVTTAVLGAEKHLTVPLAPVEGSGVTGTVQITQLPHGGSNIVVVARGLQPGTVYA